MNVTAAHMRDIIDRVNTAYHMKPPDWYLNFFKVLKVLRKIPGRNIDYNMSMVTSIINKNWFWLLVIG